MPFCREAERPGPCSQGAVTVPASWECTTALGTDKRLQGPLRHRVSSGLVGAQIKEGVARLGSGKAPDVMVSVLGRI